LYGVRGYIPEAISDGKFSELDPDYWSELTDTFYCGDDAYPGWQYSSYC
jgi:hypothetical protein